MWNTSIQGGAIEPCRHPRVGTFRWLDLGCETMIPSVWTSPYERSPYARI